MIKVITNQDVNNICSWELFENWVVNQQEIQFDIETNVTDYYYDKELKVLQFGSVTEDLQFVIDYAFLTTEQFGFIKSILSGKILKIIHRASFEYVVMAFYGVRLANIHCTLTTEKIINGGVEEVDYSLLEIVFNYTSQMLDKTNQTAFGDGILTEDKILYAANDVKYLGIIKEKQLEIIAKQKHQNVYWLEMRSLLAFSECTFNGVKLDVESWRNNIHLAAPVVESTEAELNDFLKNDPRLLSKAIEKGYYKTEDTLLLDLKSPKQKHKALQLVFPDIAGSSIGVITKYIRDNSDLPFEKIVILGQLLNKSTVELKEYLLRYCKDELINEKFLLKAGELQINWNSIQQVLELGKAVEPKLISLSTESLSKTTHPIFLKLLEYKKVLKLVSSFGEKFIEEFLEPDGKIRTNYNPIVATGRSSSAKPNMQQIPAYDKVKNRYRNCFIAEEDEVFVDSDFTGQELCLIAYTSKDDVWYEAIKNGEDLHSVTAQLVFKDKWDIGTEEGCVFKSQKQKCNCSIHKKYRTAVKTVNFGLAYGMSEFKLAATLHCSLKEARNLIDLYFKTFPQIKKTLDSFGRFGIQHGYTQTLDPFHRKRYFREWEYCKHEYSYHVNGIKRSSGLGRIERQSKNSPIQGSGADIMKLAMWYTYKYVLDNNLFDKVKIALNVHDQLTTTCKKDFADEWKIILDDRMIAAGKVVIKDGLLKAETNITEKWTK